MKHYEYDKEWQIPINCNFLIPINFAHELPHEFPKDLGLN